MQNVTPYTSANYCPKATQTEIVRARNKIFRACQLTILQGTVQGPRREKERQAEKQMGGQHPRMDGHDAGRRHEEG